MSISMAGVEDGIWARKENKVLTEYKETSLARRLSEESLCNPVSMSSPQRTRRMSCNCMVTRSRTSHNPLPTSNKSAEYETRIFGR
jgi:hypothetical protein